MNRVCRVCTYVRDIFSNPYHYSGAILARLSVSVATMIWCVVVLVKRDALIRWPGSNVITSFLGEDLFACGMLVLSFIAVYRLLRQSKPVRLGVCIYCLMALLWVYTLATLVLAIYGGETALRPGQVSAILVVTVLSLFAFIVNPKSHQGG